jgi:hypothetical protein
MHMHMHMHNMHTHARRAWPHVGEARHDAGWREGEGGIREREREREHADSIRGDSIRGDSIRGDSIRGDSIRGEGRGESCVCDRRHHSPHSPPSKPYASASAPPARARPSSPYPRSRPHSPSPSWPSSPRPDPASRRRPCPVDRRGRPTRRHCRRSARASGCAGCVRGARESKGYDQWGGGTRGGLHMRPDGLRGGRGRGRKHPGGTPLFTSGGTPSC